MCAVHRNEDGRMMIRILDYALIAGSLLFIAGITGMALVF